MQRFLQVFALSIALVATGSLAAWADGLTPKELTSGRKLYVAKCARCHKLYDPAQYPASDWARWMEKMSKKAKLKPEQKDLLERYLDGVRSGKTPPPGK